MGKLVLQICHPFPPMATGPFKPWRARWQLPRKHTMLLLPASRNLQRQSALMRAPSTSSSNPNRKK